MRNCETSHAMTSLQSERPPLPGATETIGHRTSGRTQRELRYEREASRCSKVHLSDPVLHCTLRPSNSAASALTIDHQELRRS